MLDKIKIMEFYIRYFAGKFFAEKFFLYLLIFLP